MRREEPVGGMVATPLIVKCQTMEWTRARGVGALTAGGAWAEVTSLGDSDSGSWHEDSDRWGGHSHHL